jgi:hypothetical protein
MSTINYENRNLDRTVRIFDKFFDFELEVDAATYTTVLSTFESIFDDKNAAANFTLSLFRISERYNQPVLDLLATLDLNDKLQLTATLAYYLNSLRDNSTLLGISQPILPNQNVARNVLT